MFKKLIVGVDGRDAGSDAVALARALAAPDAQIVLVHAYPFTEHPDRPSLHDYEDRLRADAIALLLAEGDDPRFERRAIPDVSPARALQAEAADEDADLVVIGSCHRGVIGRVLAGDVSRAVMHGAVCPVAVAPRGYRDHVHPVKLIGVGFDQGAPARVAAELAAELAAESGGELRVQSTIRIPVAFTPGYAYSYDWPQLAEEDRKAAKRTLAEFVASIDVPATTTITDGVPGEELERLSLDVDLLVIGSRGWGGFRRVMLGSTGDRLVHHASCPVIVAPAPAEDRAALEHEPRLARA